ncbi:hypothetical protein CROQUDRAFT_336686 [Cronartium quercuum f. sp. fusiforme G11]|uniref:Uncharacterized protein n=1 Tax=Cronartium quercuum f. sp. fusiforme G11 TaxID=708437 RepID=A0A9P6N6W5_9BASI|nr:hypothetical protein CROQUDRAFT_336686 [Cronartium quercuum f. sp. fusiforme G11]
MMLQDQSCLSLHVPFFPLVHIVLQFFSLLCFLSYCFFWLRSASLYRLSMILSSSPHTHAFFSYITAAVFCVYVCVLSRSICAMSLLSQNLGLSSPKVYLLSSSSY